MALKVDLRQFLDEKGNVLVLTEQANKVFKFLTKIVLLVSQEAVSQASFPPTIEQAIIEVDLKCNTRADALSCRGKIEASRNLFGTISMIEWHCDTCKAAGTISHWQGSLWDKQKDTIH